MKEISINYVIDEIIDMLLLNKSVLFVSDMYEYDEIVRLLKENFDEISLYGLTYLRTDSIIEVQNIQESFDNVIVYLDSNKKTEEAKTILGKNCFVF